MGISFLDRLRKRYGEVRGATVPQSLAEDREGVAGLLSECELLRARAETEGVELDDTAASLERLDQLVPRWRDDPDEQSWLGNDAGLYLGTVVVRNVPGASWQIWPNGRPVILLACGRELDVVEAGHEWAQSGTPELSQVYAEASEI
ncbi:DUF6278 family protein [Actinacidiphila sp. bgisy167]|uniref:DUF6278 family protein n=1 Tax=Actinacidiphila sp. bgisy167 TaxID=3413797 RepID=UPI003D72807C